MAGHIEWNGEQWTRDMRVEYRKNLAAASIFLVTAIKADISQPGTLRYSVKPGGKFQKTIYNFTHSIPGNPPYLQTGLLRSSIGWEFVKDGPGNAELARVGTPLKYGFYLEKGTRKMAARPFIEVNLRKHAATISAILTKKIGPGGIPPIVSNQFRPGYLGAGARRAGYL